jgi:hypothetical protein
MERVSARGLTLLVAFLVPLVAFGIRVPAGFVRSGATESEFAREYRECTQSLHPSPFMEACGKGSVTPHSAPDVTPQSFFVGWDHLFRRLATDDQAELCMRARGWSYREGFDTFRPSADDWSGR